MPSVPGSMKLDSPIRSRVAIMPPGFSTRLASANAAWVSGMCMMTAWACTTSKVSSQRAGTGRYPRGKWHWCGRWLLRRLGQRNLRLFHVDAVDFARVDGLSQPHGDGAGAAAQVQQLHTGFKQGQQVGGAVAGIRRSSNAETLRCSPWCNFASDGFERSFG